MPAVDSEKQRASKRHPTLCDHVIVGAGAQILGPITIHRCARVGGNSVVTKDVPEGTTVVGVPARQMSKMKTSVEPSADFTPYALSVDKEHDPREQTITALVNEIHSQRSRLAALEEQLANSSIALPSSERTIKEESRPGKSTR